MAPKARFTDGEKVLCFHGPLLYEAKCLKFQIRDKHMKYFIHYSGWNKNWDEWVPESRVLKYNETNLQKQKELTLTYKSNKKAKGLKLPIKKEKDVEKEKESITQSSPPEKPKVKPEKRHIPSPVPDVTVLSDTSNESKKKFKIELCFLPEVEPKKDIHIEFPQLLKNWLIDDYNLITHQKKILHLPARVTVDHIIAGFVKEKVSIKGLSQTKETMIVQFGNSIRDLFNEALGKRLLYKFERPQYGEMLSDYSDFSMCQIYGAIHMLRLLTKLGSMLTPMHLKGKALSQLLEQINAFIRYMSHNPSFFILNDYEVATPEYHRRAL